MTNISQYMPTEHEVIRQIYAAYKKRGDAESARGYLGASVIGSSCDRYLWYVFRACVKEEFSGRMRRLLERGDLEELRMAKDLRDIGCEVHENMGEECSYAQYEITDFGDHFSGHLDGCALGIPGAEKTWHVLEFKTHNAKSFALLLKEGVQESKPTHYAQMQVYMCGTGMKRALYLAVNKDTDELHAERVKYDKNFALSLMARAKAIIIATEPPERVANREDWWECRFCSAHDLCWGAGEVALPIPAINCRQCCHATPTMDGKARWVCEKHKRGLTESSQAAACGDHLVLPGLISFAEPANYGEDEDGSEYIDFTNRDGSTWAHGQHCLRNVVFSTSELRALPVSALTNQAVMSAKELFSAEATHYIADDILSRYPANDTRLVWKGLPAEMKAAWQEAYGKDMDDSTQLAECSTPEYHAIEFEGSRVAVMRKDRMLHPAEIWEGVE